MGSSARRHSSGQPAASLRARKGNRKRNRRAPRSRPDLDFDAILGGLSDSLSILITATHALSAAEQCEGTTQAKDVGDEIITLERGVTDLKRYYDALDVALREVRA